MARSWFRHRLAQRKSIERFAPVGLNQGLSPSANDLWDLCSTNSIAVGLHYPELIPLDKAGGKSHKLFISIWAPKGKSDIGKLSARVQPVEHMTCDDLANPMKLTDCMGANNNWPWDGVGDRTARPVLGAGRNWWGPNKCWYSHGYGDEDTPPRSYTNGCGLSANPWAF